MVEVPAADEEDSPLRNLGLDASKVTGPPGTRCAGMLFFAKPTVGEVPAVDEEDAPACNSGLANGDGGGGPPPNGLKDANGEGGRFKADNCGVQLPKGVGLG